jgi:hypothetical protein
MPVYDAELAAFVEKHGEQSVVSALKAYVSQRARLAKYAAKNAESRKAKAAERKEQNKFAKELAKAASSPEGAAKVRELLAAKGINL